EGNGAAATAAPETAATAVAEGSTSTSGGSSEAGGDSATLIADPAALRAEYEQALRELREMQGENALIPVEVTAETIGAVVSDWTGIPIGKMVKDEAKQLLEFEQALRERIKGQDHVAE